MEKKGNDLEPYTVQDIYDISNDFKDMLVYISNNLDEWDKKVELKDKACIDLMHFIEFNPKVSLAKKTSVWKEFNKIREERRFYKNLIQVVNSYRTLVCDKKFLNGFFHNINDLNKNFDIVTGDRKYAPRVLLDLFKEEKK